MNKTEPYNPERLAKHPVFAQLTSEQINGIGEAISREAEEIHDLTDLLRLSGKIIGCNLKLIAQQRRESGYSEGADMTEASNPQKPPEVEG